MASIALFRGAISLCPSERLVMDFIEKLFGIAPDGGSGALEFLLFAAPVAGIAYLAMRRRRRGLH
jgi:hypothetical protein